ncbi:MAG TPA: alpha/beta fold hydrolase [Turneriella sp.]|nr:alpha/beta fold hydrolase [Turneriella sp.]
MPVIESNYRHPRLLKNPHLHTVLSAVLRKKPQVAYVRERLELPDGDFIDLDWSVKDKRRLVILAHGMEGSSKSKYILHTVQAINNAGVSAVAWNMRGCSGDINRKLHFYHSGKTEDLAAVVDHARQLGFRKIYLVGFSLGGNLTLLYLARAAEKIRREIQRAVAICAPVDLVTSQDQIERKENRLYLKRFLRDFHKKFERKRQHRKIYIDTQKFHRRIRTLAHLDAHYTAPWNGFPNEKEYYRSASSLPLLQQIRIPTLLLNPKDDTFLSENCYPVAEAKNSNLFHLEMPETGGHCAMLTNYRLRESYMERRILEFLQLNPTG